MCSRGHKSPIVICMDKSNAKRKLLQWRRLKAAKLRERVEWRREAEVQAIEDAA
jgi:hypothetical protein